MTTVPSVSVIVPLYNYENYIGDCIRSIMTQDYPDFELIVVDDCSTDKSYKIAKKLESTFRGMKILKQNVNGGYSKAKNDGIEASIGRIIITLDADDMMVEGSISARVFGLQKYNVPFVSAYAWIFKGDATLDDCLSKKVDFKLSEWSVHAQTVAMYRWVHHKYGLYDEDLRATADKEMWMRLFGPTHWTKGGGPGQGKKDNPLIKMKRLDDVVAYYRKHKKSMSWMKGKNLGGYNAKQLKALAIKKVKIRAEQGISEKNTRMLRT